MNKDNGNNRCNDSLRSMDADMDTDMTILKN